MNQPHILLLFGGESSEHDVSLLSARNVYSAIDRSKFQLTLCYIDREGGWWLANDINETPDSAPRLTPRLGERCFVVDGSNEIISPDVIFPVLHGRGGEDGSVQGLAQLLHIPIVGCSTSASALGMDKIISKEIAAQHAVPIVPFLKHHISDTSLDYEAVSRVLGATVFVKPNRAGSSVGVSKATDSQEFMTALQTAHQHDEVVLIEQAISARELEVAALGTFPDVQISPVGEIIPGAEFYDYNDKYSDNSTSSEAIPAAIDENIALRIQQYARDVYVAIGASGLSRIDFFLSSNGDVYFNEINTLPGFTNISMYPQLWQYVGINHGQLVEKLIEDALTR